MFGSETKWIIFPFLDNLYLFIINVLIFYDQIQVEMLMRREKQFDDVEHKWTRINSFLKKYEVNLLPRTETISKYNFYTFNSVPKITNRFGRIGTQLLANIKGFYRKIFIVVNFKIYEKTIYNNCE